MLYIKEWREARGVTQQELADAIGRDKSIISKIESGKITRPAPDQLAKIATRLGIAPAALYQPPPMGTSPHNIGSISLAAHAAGESGQAVPSAAQPANDRLNTPGEQPRDVPVMGTTAGSNGQGAFILNTGEPIDWVRRPPGIAQARRIYALYVENDSMDPRYCAGELVYVDPNRPAAIGDHVVVQQIPRKDDAPVSFIKRLEKRSPKELTFAQYNPAGTLTMARDTVLSVHYVLTYKDLAG